MRIAVSGTHSTGKTTLIEEFLQTHSYFIHEPEPYVALVEEYGEEFAAELGVDDFFRQLEFNVERLRAHSVGECVIYERCPVDFIAYILALKDLRREDVASGLLETWIELVVDGLRYLELIVYLPISDDLEAPDDEDPRLRKAVDKRLGAIFTEDDHEIVSVSGTAIIEARGSTRQRLTLLESAMR